MLSTVDEVIIFVSLANLKLTITGSSCVLQTHIVLIGIITANKPLHILISYYVYYVIVISILRRMFFL